MDGPNQKTTLQEEANTTYIYKEMKLRRLNFIDYRWKHAIVAPLIPGTKTLSSPLFAGIYFYRNSCKKRG
jgi:hypothetical protein